MVVGAVSAREITICTMSGWVVTVPVPYTDTTLWVFRELQPDRKKITKENNEALFAISLGGVQNVCFSIL
jgi:hypothetical protein